jgi:hypothetical protein
LGRADGCFFSWSGAKSHGRIHARIEAIPRAASSETNAYLLIDLVDHHGHDHTCNANIKPQGQRPARDDPMFVETLEERAAKCNKNQGNDDDGKNGVRSQQDEIDGADPALSVKWDVANAVVVQQIGKTRKPWTPQTPKS